MSSRHARVTRANKPTDVVVAKKAFGAATNKLNGAFSSTFIEPERRRALIAEAAYYRSERRGFEPGHELEDWCAAEIEIDTSLVRGETPLPAGGRSGRGAA